MSMHQISRFLRQAVVLLLVALCGCASTGQSTSAIQQGGERRVSGAWLFARAHDAAKHGDYVRAEHYLLSAREHGFDEETVLHALLDVCVASNNLRRALEHTEAALRASPERHGLRVVAASLRSALGDDVGAERELVRVLHGDPRHPDALLLLATLIAKNPVEIERARALLATYLELRPSASRSGQVRDLEHLLSGGTKS